EKIASDGGILNEAVELKDLEVSASERAEIIVDFSQFDEDEVIMLMMDDETIVPAFQVNENKSESENEIELPKESIESKDEEMEIAVSKEVTLSGMYEDVKINGKQFDMDRIDFTQIPGETEVWEIYNEPDDMCGMIHPFHIHGTQFKVISINGEKPP